MEVATKTNLYKHQDNAFKKLSNLKVGALFMEMGTGKTRTMIEIIARKNHKISKVIWCCPVSIKETIKQEILKHTDTQEDEIYIFNAKTNDKNIPKAKFYILGIESIGMSSRVTVSLNAIVDEKTMIVVDESSYIKGHSSNRAKRLTLIGDNAKYRFILTGTPVSQGIVDLYSQFNFLSYKILGYRSFWTFAKNHIVYSDKFKGMIVDTKDEKYIADQIEPFVYQVQKSECLDLPSKIYENRYFEMSDEQRCDYEFAKSELIQAIREEDVNIGDVFSFFITLQQIVSGFHKSKIYKNDRINTMINIIKEINEDEKIIIWAKYKKDIDNIKNALIENFKSEVSIFTGDIKPIDRQKELDNFRKNTRFFIATPSAGGFGLTLNEAHNVIFYNNSFKYAERLQAEDRCHRIGQEEKVTYIDILCSNSIDIKIYKALLAKEDIVECFKREIEEIKNRGIEDEKSILETISL